jgi:hypothetical protein
MIKPLYLPLINKPINMTIAYYGFVYCFIQNEGLSIDYFIHKYLTDRSEVLSGRAYL